MATNIIDADRLAEVLRPIELTRDRLEAIASAVAGFAPKAVRLNRLAGVQPETLGFPVEPVPWLPGWGYWPIGDVQPGRRIAFGAGLYYVQDAGSLLAVSLLNPQPGELVCDLCAAPGGKSTAILEALGQSGGLLANETIRSRIDPLALNLARQGASRYVVTSLDPEQLSAMLPCTFAAVLADVPCSGQSLVGSGKQRVSSFDGRLVSLNAARQRRILTAAAKLVRPGGRLIYSTCTFSWAENEAVIQDFLGDYREFVLQPEARLAPWQAPSPAPDGCYRLWPDRHPVAGAFAARMIRRETLAADEMPTQPVHLRKPRLHPRSITDLIPWKEWGTWSSDVHICPVRPYLVAALPADLQGPLLQLVRTGRAAALPLAAQAFGKTWQPSYVLAMRRDGTFDPHQAVELSDDEARIYLRGESVVTPVRGWAVARWNGWPLGWLHGSGRTAANKLNKAARLACPQ